MTTSSFLFLLLFLVAAAGGAAALVESDRLDPFEVPPANAADEDER